MNGDKEKLVAVVRVRGNVHVKKELKETLRHLKLNKVNHASIHCIDSEKKHMLTKVNDYCTWGEVREDVLKKLLAKRGKVKGGGRLTDEYLKKNTKYTSIQELAKNLMSCKTKPTSVEGLKPVFRLNPPVKGHAAGGIKKNVSVGGALGYRGDSINKLLEAMI